MLAAQRRWRELAWTAGAGAALSAVALAVFGPGPFVSFFDFHLPRLGDGRAFAFGEAWPQMATLVTAGNQGVHGIVLKLEAMGIPGANAALARVAGQVYGVLLLGLALIAGLRTRRATRAELTLTWLGLLSLGSLASTGAWADYVPLTGVWLLAFLVPLAAAWRPALASTALRPSTNCVNITGSSSSPSMDLTRSVSSSRNWATTSGKI